MNRMVYIKMKREGDSLERVLGTIRERGCEVVEMTARCSLDESCYFVRMSLEGNGSTDILRDRLSAVDEVRQVEIESGVSTSA